MRIKLGDLNIITLILVALKLFNVITVSWWIVVSPTLLWLVVILFVIVLAIVLIIAGSIQSDDFIKKMEEFNNRNKKGNK